MGSSDFGSTARLLTASLNLLAEMLVDARPIDEQNAKRVRSCCDRIEALVPNGREDVSRPDLVRAVLHAVNLCREIEALHKHDRAVTQQCALLVEHAQDVLAASKAAAAETLVDED